MLLLLLLLSLFLLVLLGFYVFVAAPRSRTHQTFAAFVLCLALWTVKDIVLWEFSGRAGASAVWWANASFIIALVLQYSLVVFAWLFPENRRVPYRRAAVLFAPGAVFIPATLAGLMWQEASFSGGRFNVELRSLAYAFGLYIYFLFGYGFALLYKKFRRYRSELWGQQLGAILWALALTGALTTLATIALPLVGVYALLPYGAVFVLPGVLVYAYAISNFKLFSLQSALDQFRLFPIAYKVALSIAAVAVLSFLAMQIPIVWWSFGAATEEAWRRYLVFSIVSALVPNLILVALVIRIISRPLRRLTEAAVEVSGGAYGTQVRIGSTNDEVGLLAASFNEMSRKMASDIEHLRALGEQLVRTEKLAAAGTLAAGVAHEVNNPLASISSLIQILQTRAAAAATAANDADAQRAETREMLRLISTQIARITQVLRDMMDFARTRPPTRAPLDVRRALDASIRLASFDKDFKRLDLTTDYDDSAPLVSADTDQLQQVFLNLLLNARDAMPAGGRIRVSTAYRRHTQELLIEIADNGAGIAAEHRAHIFDPFFTTKPAGTGTGLGLAVCYGIITAHGGTIEVASNAHAVRGTTVRIALPVAPDAH